MSLTDRLKNSARVTVHLAKLVSLVHLFFWRATTGRAGVFETELTGDVTGVFEDESVLTEVADVDAVEAAAGTFYHDRRAGLLYAHPTGGDPYAAVFRAEIETRLANVAKEHEGAPYPARLKSAPVIKIADSAQFGELEKKSSGKLKISDADGRLKGFAGLVPQAVSFKLGVDLP